MHPAVLPRERRAVNKTAGRGEIDECLVFWEASLTVQLSRVAAS